MPETVIVDGEEYIFPDEIPPFPRKPTEPGAVETGRFWLNAIDARIRKLERLGLRPHPIVLEHRIVMERGRAERAPESPSRPQ